MAALIDTNVRGAATYGLSWFDAHLWAYAERFGLNTIYSEDFAHDRRYGRVRTINPFASSRPAERLRRLAVPDS